MSRRHAEEMEEKEIPVLHPRCRENIVAYEAQQELLLRMVNEKRLPHAILLAGKKGIGKATLAYRLARFLLSQEDNAGASLFGDPLPVESLQVSAIHPVFRRVVSGGHPDLLVLEGDDIKIEEARKVPEFLSLTPAESRWRVVVIDCAEAMNRNAMNALLKTLEEPPSQAVLLLISHSPGMLLPTIRSRCRTFRMPSLNEAQFAAIMADIAPHIHDGEYGKWALLSGTSPGIALELIGGEADVLYEELLERMAARDTVKLHAFAERFARKDADPDWQILKRLTLWLVSRIASVGTGLKAEVFMGEGDILQNIHARKPAYFWNEAWDKSSALFSETEHLYLDRKQAIISLIRMML